MTDPNRQARRERIRAQYIARAEVHAARAERSMKCGDYGAMNPPWHADHPSGWGCQNDGSTCICECHDG